jgi:hypothetical protein
MGFWENGVPMTEHWSHEELKTTQLDDQRLNQRFAAILEAFADRPHASIPTAVGARAEERRSGQFKPHFYLISEQNNLSSIEVKKRRT